MHHGQTNERIDVFGFLDEAFPARQLIPQQVLGFGRRIDNRAGRLVHQRCSRRGPNIQLDALDRAADSDRRRHGTTL